MTANPAPDSLHHITQEHILKAEKVFRLNLINSITGIKPANLVGTRSRDGSSNLAIFSSVIHLGSNPPLLGMILRPKSNIRRHTAENIEATGKYTLNHVPTSKTQEAHHTSAKFEADQSEFDTCGFTEVFRDDFPVPYVAESPIQIGMKFAQAIPIEANSTTLVIGEVQHIYLQSSLLSDEGYIDLEQSQSSGISGLNSYYSFNKIADYPYARVSQIVK